MLRHKEITFILNDESYYPNVYSPIGKELVSLDFHLYLYNNRLTPHIETLL